MKIIKIKNKKGKTLARVYVYLKSFKNKNRKEIVEDILGDFKNNYAGYKKREHLSKFLNWSCFGWEKKESFNFEVDRKKEEKLAEVCEETIKLCKEFIKKPINIFVFPSLDSWTMKNMGGCGGFCTAPRTLVVDINFVQGWEHALKATIGHELAHAISPYYKGGDYALGEGFILDGIAEHFRESIVGGDKSKWSNAITRNEAVKLLKELKAKFGIKDQNLWQEVFFGGGTYPHWAGYSTGYYLVEDYLKKQKQINWEKIIATPAKEIFEEMLKEGYWEVK